MICRRHVSSQLRRVLTHQPVNGGYPLGPGAPKYSTSGTSAVSELELETGAADRPRLDTLGRGPVGTGGAVEGSGGAP